jgi:hypothetical protein
MRTQLPLRVRPPTMQGSAFIARVRLRLWQPRMRVRAFATAGGFDL